MKFGLMFFAASEDSLGVHKYRLVVESARFADRQGFSSVWVPERHFTGFGGLYPNPAVLHAGLATCTSNIRLNAGSVVAPLHNPLRIAEEWSVVDNLSNGRVGVSFASGWNPNDFVFFPDHYADRHERVIDTMHAVQRLWHGEAFVGTNGVGQPASVTIFPKPVQRALPVWLTVAGNPSHFERAGTSGANLLTHLLDQDEDGLAARVKLYRDARAAAGFDPATGVISLMIHTFVGADAETVREQARAPYCNYIKANINLFKGLAQSRGRDADLSKMSPRDLDEFVNFLYDRFAASRGLIGTPESCAPLVARLEQIGVTELACLLDFGPDVDLILENLPQLARLKDLHATRSTMPSPALTGPHFDVRGIQQRCGDVLSGDEFHRLLSGHGIHISGAFQSVNSIWRREGEALAQLLLAPSDSSYQVHPASLDACGRILAAALPDLGRAGAASYVPTGFDACDFFAPLSGSAWVHATITGRSNGSAASVVRGDVDIYDEHGQQMARLAGVCLKAVEHRPRPAADVSHLLYERTWQVVADRSTPIDARGRWVVIADQQGVATELIKQLEANGGECLPAADGSTVRGIVYLRGLDAMTRSDANTETLEGDIEHAVHGALSIAQSGVAAPVWIVTRGAVPVLNATGAISVSQAPLWGFGRALAVERPDALGALVDLDPLEQPAEAARQLLQVLASDHGEDMVAFRSGTSFVPRLRRTNTIDAATASAVTFDGDDTILITGGSGGLGLRVAEWAVARGARHLVLCNRREPSSSVDLVLQRLRASGVDAVVEQADVADFAALQSILERSVESRPPVTAVFHLAGVLDDGVLVDQTWERFAGVFAAKVSGAWNLHRLTRDTSLKHFVLFSSVSSLMPAPGQSNYAAANAFLDGLAYCRRSQGLPALVVNWGPWSEVGHAQSDYGQQAHARLRSLGIGSIDPVQGLGILETLLQQGVAQAAAVAIDWTQFFQRDPAAARLGLLADLVAETKPQSIMPRPEASAIVATLAALPRDQRRPYLLRYLSDLVIAALKLRTTEPLDARQRLFDIGLDSIVALELKDRLERELEVPLSATLLFVRPTLDALAEYILTDIVPDTAPPAAKTSSELSEDDLTLLLLKEIDASRGA